MPVAERLMTEEQVGSDQKRPGHELGGDKAEGEGPGPQQVRPAERWKVEAGSCTLQWLS